MKTSNATETSALASARDSLRGPRGKTVWRSLEELAEKPSFQEMLQREFPRHAAEWGNVDRRRFLQLSGAGLGLAGLTACTKQPPEKIVPYVRQPEDVVPGKPMYYASAVSRSGYAAPVLGECHMGRPTKLEGNPEHPASRGGTDTITQASILDLYDPDRSEAITHLGQIRTWDAFVEQVEALRLQHVAQDGEDREVLGGEGLAFVTGNVTSPTMARLLAELDRQMPKARRFAVDSSAGAHGYGVTERAFGEALQTHFDFDKADVVLSVDADFLSDGPAGVAYSKVFSARRRAYNVDEARSMVRLYSVESVPSSTTATADHRLALHPTQVGHFLVALAARLGVAGAEEPEGLAEDPRVLAWLEEVTADLQTHAGRSAVVVGEFEDVELQVLGLAINEKLGNLDQTVFFTDPVVVRAKDDAGLPELATAIEAGEVTTLVLLGVNPVYDSPADIDMAALMEKVALRLHLGPHLDETAQYCHWHVPQSHDLESWGDLRSADGSVTVLQPLVNPLYDSHTAIDMVAAFLGRGDDGAMQLVQETWRAHYDAVGGGEQEGQTFERTWRRWLHDGFLRGTEE
ncbi:MAG: TAT-variant-translocated molybdopterin oxidoreductase, partial [Acidobacteriota bacterium]